MGLKGFLIWFSSMAYNISIFKVKEGCEEPFLELNRNEWPELFSRSTAYIDTHIYPLRDIPGMYLTADEWRSKSGFDAFMKNNSDDYWALDARHHEYVESEIWIGFCYLIEGINSSF